MKNADIAYIVNALPDNERMYLTRYIESLEGERKDVMVLGNDEFFALKDKNGDIRAMKKRIRLTASERHLVQITNNGPYVLSAKGYEVLANESGIQVVFPASVMVDGKQQANPHMTRDPKTGRILSCYARAIAYRYSPAGMPQVADWTTVFDIPSYRLQDLISKAKKTAQAFKLLPNDLTPESKAGETWARYPFDEATSLWVNTAHKDAIDWYSNLTAREKKIIDTAQTFARRNVVKHLTGLAEVPGQIYRSPAEGTKNGEKYTYTKETVTPFQVWDMEITVWIPSNDGIIRWNGSQYAELRKQLENIISNDEAKPVEIVGVGSEEVSVVESEELNKIDPEIQDAEYDIVPPQTPQSDAHAAQSEPIIEQPSAEKTKPADAPEKQSQPPSNSPLDQAAEFRRRLWNNYQAIKQNFPDEYAQAVKICGGVENTSSRDWIMEVIARVNEIIDTRQ